MARKRPTSVTVMGVLNLVFGILGLLAVLCGGGVVALAVAGLSNAPPPKPGEPDLVGLFKAIDQEVPSYKIYMGASLVIGLILSIVLIVAGVGLLRMKRFMAHIHKEAPAMRRG